MWNKFKDDWSSAWDDANKANGTIFIIAPRDPNDLTGPQGFGDEHWVSGNNALPYTIHFENQASATAPAQQVTITLPLDADLNANSFRLGDFGWGGLTFSVPQGSSFYSERLDLTASKGFLVDVVAGVDVAAGQAFWSLTTIDPATGEIPANPTIGFLPPDADGSVGQGFVNYSVKPAAAAPPGAVVDAQATIVFATQEPIDTPAIHNTLDTLAPASQMQSGTAPPASALLVGPTQAADPAQITVHAAQFQVSWAGSDTGSGVASYTVYVSDNGGDYSPWLAGTALTQAVYAGQAGHSYAFYSVAKDNAGNIEAAPPQPDLLVQAAADAAPTDLTPPAITSLSLPTDGIYSSGQALDFAVHFSEAVFVDAASVTPPTIGLGLGSAISSAQYVSGGGTDTLIFRHLLQSGEFAPGGIDLANSIVLNGGSLGDQAGNPALSLSFTHAATAGIKADNAPTLASPLADQSALEGHAFSFAVPANSFADADTGDTLAYAATQADGSALPAWLHFDPATRSFSGAPAHADAGSLDIKVSATDSANAVASDNFLLDVAPLARLEIHPLNAVAAEGNAGVTHFSFDVIRSENTALAATADYAVSGSGNRPASANDFAAGVLPGGSVSFLPGETHKTVVVDVAGDTQAEFNEQFAVTLVNPANAYLGVASAVATIQNDDYASLHIGDAPARPPKSDPGAWERSWSNSHLEITHKANLADTNEAYSKVSFTDTGSGLLSGGDISGGDLGVSGQTLATSSVRQEIDGTEGLRFVLDSEASGISFNLSRFFANDDGTGLKEAGRVQFFSPAHQLVKEVQFYADGATGTRQLEVSVPQGFSEAVFSAGASNGGNFVFGALGNAVGDGFGANPGGGHGSDYLVHAVTFEFGEVAIIGSALQQNPIDLFMV